MEKSEVESVRYIDYKEYFALFVWTALALLVIETLLGCTVLRRAP